MFTKGIAYTRRSGVTSAIVACMVAVALLPAANAEAAPRAAAKQVKVKASKVPAAKNVRAQAAASPGKKGARKAAALGAGASSAYATVPVSDSYQSYLANQSGLRLELPKLASQAAFVLDASTGMPLLVKNGHDMRPIASITKLMTAMVVLDARLSMDERLKVTDDDVDRMRHSSSRLPVGSELSRSDMLHLALMASENRAAHALARTYPGGIPAFVQAMNAKANALGLKHTPFKDPTGLDAGNMASPRDLAHMVAAASKYPVIRQFSTEEQEVVRLRNHESVFRNTNALVRRDDWKIAVSKTGYIREAGRCLVMQASINNRPTLIVLLNSEHSAMRIQDSRSIKHWLEQRETQATLKAAEVLFTRLEHHKVQENHV